MVTRTICIVCPTPTPLLRCCYCLLPYLICIVTLTIHSYIEEWSSILRGILTGGEVFWGMSGILCGILSGRPLGTTDFFMKTANFLHFNTLCHGAERKMWCFIAQLMPFTFCLEDVRTFFTFKWEHFALLKLHFCYSTHFAIRLRESYCPGWKSHFSKFLFC